MIQEKSAFKAIGDVPESKWNELSEKVIYFGHQSVGNNIVDGLMDVIRGNPQIKLNVVETNDPEMFTKPVFGHSRVGENYDPISKNRSFFELMEKGIGRQADMAFFKYCYVDVKAETDVKKIFSMYKDTLLRLKDKYPQTTFVHVTVPLVVVQTGPKVLIKKIIGREIGGYEDNIKRNIFNNMLREQYQGQEPIFDLAKIESTTLDGKAMIFKKGGQIFYAMIPEYARDGRHLNENGRRIVAEQLLVFLASLTDKE